MVATSQIVGEFQQGVLPMRFLSFFCCTLALPAFAQFNGMSASGNGSSATVTISMSSNTVTVPCVTGAPYSGTQTSQSIQTLADGTRITRPATPRETTRRDSAGRVRTERELFPARPGAPQSSFMIVKVQDPVAGYAYLLDSVNQVAHRTAIKSMAATGPFNPPQQVGSRTLPDGTVSVTESLGEQIMFGVTAIGTKTTMTHPAGSRMGNDRPVTTTSELWWSPQLREMVMSINTSPEGNVSTMSMSDLSTAEPDAALFQIPASYKVVDESGSFTFTVALTK
jgi:hypothetical protein